MNDIDEILVEIEAISRKTKELIKERDWLKQALIDRTKETYKLKQEIQDMRKLTKNSTYAAYGKVPK